MMPTRTGQHRGIPAGAEANWAGPRAATCGSNTAGREPISTLRGHAAELVALAPDVIVALAAPHRRGALQQASRAVPIVFAIASIRSAAGFVASLSRPGGNVTGIQSPSNRMSGKWLELLKEIAPGVKRVAVMLDPAIRRFGSGRDPSRGAILRGAVKSGRRTRRRRNRARHHGIRSRTNGGLIVPARLFGAAASRTDRRAGGAAPVPAVYSTACSSPTAA